MPRGRRDPPSVVLTELRIVFTVWVWVEARQRGRQQAASPTTATQRSAAKSLSDQSDEPASRRLPAPSRLLREKVDL